MYTELREVAIPFLHWFSGYDVKTMQLISARTNERIKLKEIKYLATYLRSADYEEVANQLCKTKSTVQKSVQRISRKIGFSGPKDMLTDNLGNTIAPILDTFVEIRTPQLSDEHAKER